MSQDGGIAASASHDIQYLLRDRNDPLRADFCHIEKYSADKSQALVLVKTMGSDTQRFWVHTTQLCAVQDLAAESAPVNQDIVQDGDIGQNYPAFSAAPSIGSADSGQLQNPLRHGHEDTVMDNRVEKAIVFLWMLT